METWRLLHTWDGAPGFHMALDEAMLLLPRDRPSLRFYTWRPETLSLGYFQRVADVPGLRDAPAAVRRMTGGGAIYHANELTFSIAAPQDHPLYAGAVRASYERVHGLIATVLADLRVEAEPRGDRALASDRPVGGMCFEESTDVDLAWDGAKGVGSAQRRAKGRVVHHGSIKLGRSRLDANVAAIWDHAPGIEAPELADRLVAGFRSELGIALEAGEATADELAHAAERADHFTPRAFVHRR